MNQNTTGSTGGSVISMTGGLAPIGNQTFTGAQLVQIIGFMALAGISIVKTNNLYQVESTADFAWLDEDRTFASANDILAYLAPLVLQHGPNALTNLVGKVAA